MYRQIRRRLEQALIAQRSATFFTCCGGTSNLYRTYLTTGMCFPIDNSELMDKSDASSTSPAMVG